jgi:hypothetical protein
MLQLSASRSMDKEDRMSKSAWYLIGFVVLMAVYIFGTGGLSLNTVCGFVGYIVAGMGVLAFIGGMKKAGAVVCVVGIVIANIPSMLK